MSKDFVFQKAIMKNSEKENFKRLVDGFIRFMINGILIIVAFTLLLVTSVKYFLAYRTELLGRFQNYVKVKLFLRPSHNILNRLRTFFWSFCFFQWKCLPCFLCWGNFECNLLYSQWVRIKESFRSVIIATHSLLW